MGKNDEYQRGYDAGFQAGYVQGRLSKQSELQEEARRQKAAPLPHERPTSNGWVQVTPELAEDFALDADVSEAYVLRDMSGEIIGITQTR